MVASGSSFGCGSCRSSSLKTLPFGDHGANAGIDPCTVEFPDGSEAAVDRHEDAVIPDRLPSPV